MPISTSVIETVTSILGTTGQPYQFLRFGEPLDTGCMAWHLPIESEAAYPALQLTRQLDALTAAYQARAAAAEGTGHILARIRQLLAPYEPAQTDGLEVYTLDEFIPDALWRQVNPLLWQVRSALQGEPVVVYRADFVMWATYPIVARQLVVAPTTDQFDSIRVERMQAEPIEDNSEAIIKELKELDRQLGIDIVGATWHSVDFVLKRVPSAEEAASILESSTYRLLAAAGMLGSLTRGRVVLLW